MRTVRELGQLGFFDAEQIDPQMENVDPNSGTIDVGFNLVESGASQIELQEAMVRVVLLELWDFPLITSL